MGVISHQQIKYFLNIVWCVFIIVYLLINVLDIINCLQGLKLAAAVAVVIEVGCCYLISGSAIEEKTSWKVQCFSSYGLQLKWTKQKMQSKLFLNIDIYIYI